MALHSSLPIYKDVYALTMLVANLVSNIPRKHKRGATSSMTNAQS